ncbi:MAG: long-chain fatty acid--CoA ligase [Planctomycetota bacterium]
MRYGRTVARKGDKVAIEFVRATLTYRQLGAEVDKLAGVLHGLGVRKGDRVAIQLPNLPQTVIGFYAALSLGAVVVMTNPLYTLREVEHQWADAEVKVAITADFVWDQLLKEHANQLAPEHFLIASIPDYFSFPISWIAKRKLGKQNPARWAKVEPGPKVHLYKAAMGKAGHAPKLKQSWDDVALLQYTGGTTGLSKGATLTHKNLSCNIQQMMAWFGDLEHSNHVMMTALPLFHVFGLTVCMGLSVAVGLPQVLLPNPRDIAILVKELAKHKVTLFPAVPAMFNAINQLPDVDQYDLSSLRECFSGSAPISDAVLNAFEKRTGGRIIEGFGMSETSPVAAANPVKGLRKVGSVGIALPDTDIRIVDMEDGVTDMPFGEEGELIVGGPQVMQGYWKRPDESAQVLRDGYMYTGDLATMDEDGFLRIVGRKKDMINCNGLKVYPDEVDAVLMDLPEVLEAATIGVPDEKRGESVKSFVVLKPGKSLTVEQVLTHCGENLARYKVPQEVEFLAELPKSSVLKTLRRELRVMEEKKRGMR